MIRCLIVDDESLARSELVYLLKDYPEINVVGEADNALEALKLCETQSIDLMFVDIEMPKINGIELADIIMKKKNPPKIIFVTAYDEFAIQAFKVNASDYLLKPVDKEQFHETIINKVHPLLNRSHDKNQFIVPKLTVSAGDKLIPLNYSKIVYITVENRETIVYTPSKRYIINKTLNEIHGSLNDPRFFRSHKSFIVNTHFIEIIEPWFNATLRLKMKGIKEHIPVSRTYLQNFKRIMNIE